MDLSKFVCISTHIHIFKSAGKRKVGWLVLWGIYASVTLSTAIASLDSIFESYFAILIKLQSRTTHNFFEEKFLDMNAVSRRSTFSNSLTAIQFRNVFFFPEKQRTAEKRNKGLLPSNKLTLRGSFLSSVRRSSSQFV